MPSAIQDNNYHGLFANYLIYQLTMSQKLIKKKNESIFGLYVNARDKKTFGMFTISQVLNWSNNVFFCVKSR